ncbi:hypothetical protein MAR_020183, partial [Mya arenaria]
MHGSVYRRLKSQWFPETSWLRYSPSRDSVVCAPCYVFGSKDKGNAISTNPVSDWSYLWRMKCSHQKLIGHRDSMEASENLGLVIKGQKQDICQSICTAYSDLVTRNRTNLSAIVATIFLCGKQNIALCGHEEETSHFKVVLREKAKTDSTLADHLTSGDPTFPSVCESLEELGSNHNDAKSVAYLNAVTKFNFIVTAVKHVLAGVAPLSLLLQKKDCDLLTAAKEASVIKTMLKGERENEAVLEALYNEAVDIARGVDVEPSLPRLYGRQRNILNVPAQDTSTYGRINMLLNGQDRFAAERLLSLNDEQLTRDDTAFIYNTYCRDLNVHEPNFARKVDKWNIMWTLNEQETRPQSMVDTSNAINRFTSQVHNIYRCFAILLCMPFTTATAE